MNAKLTSLNEFVMIELYKLAQIEWISLSRTTL